MIIGVLSLSLYIYNTHGAGEPKPWPISSQKRICLQYVGVGNAFHWRDAMWFFVSNVNCHVVRWWHKNSERIYWTNSWQLPVMFWDVNYKFGTICMNVGMYVCMHVCMYCTVCMHARVYLYVCMYVWMYVCMYCACVCACHCMCVYVIRVCVYVCTCVFV